MGVSRWAESREASHSDRMSRGKQGKMEETGKKGKIVENGETGETGGNRGKQRRERLCRPLPQLWAILAFYCSLNARCSEENCYSMTTENKTNECPGYTEPRTQIFDKNPSQQAIKNYLFSIHSICEGKDMICALSRWCTLATHDETSASQYSSEKPQKILELVFSQNLADEMSCHQNVAAADYLFLFCIFDSIWILYPCEGSIRGRQSADGGGLVVKIYDSLRSKWSILGWTEKYCQWYCKTPDPNF